MRGIPAVDFRRKLVAWWLLLLLVRVLAPEAAVLRLHFHRHTEEEPAMRGAAAKSAHKAVLTAKHQHCHVEQLYDAPFQPALPVVVAEPLRLRPYAEYRPEAPVCRAAHLLDGACPRGPPARRA